ncbi:YadA-like family protein [Mannheimia haemolytica]|uniref:YadA-like family protein n=1 Tax=Mannheimia haemolytica TaxID=75985 RepID=UPI00201BC097|nr:YadA-like family protein [Mannheimia haemolytica]UQX77407.1 YadA-like family protein [Mannheimia haemolytica]
MNKIFKVIFNQTTQKMEVVSELARSQGKAASSTDKRGTIKLAAASILGGATLISGMAAFMLSATPAEAAVIIDRIENKNENNSVNKVVIHTNASVPTNYTTNPYNYFNPGSLSYADRTKPQASGNPNKNGTDSRLLYNSNTTSAIVIGHHATAVEDVTVTQGKKAKASGVAIGDYSHAGGALSIAIGPFSRTASIGSVALGTSARADGFNSFAAMRQSAAIADYSIAIGSSSWANATASFAMGASATALGDRSFAIGSGTPKTVDGSRGKENRRSIYDGQNNTLAFGTDAFSIGTKAKTNGNRSFAIGTNAWSGGFKLEKHATINELGSVFNPDTAKVANNAFALGTNTRANSNDTVAFSTNANATGDGSIAFGVNSNTKGTGAIAFGNASKAWKANAISIGWNATSHAEKVISIGSHSNARKHGAMAIGDTANSSGNHSVAIGYSANVSNANATAVGTRANITHKGGTAIGFEAESKGNYATAIAYNSTASGKNSIAAGVNSNVSGTRAAALGYNNTVSELGKDTFVLGSNVTVKTAGSVILGSDSTEATATTEDTATVGTLTYSGFAGDENVVAGDYVSVGNATNARQIKFVAPGKIASNSTDAINGSQLYAVADTLVKTGFNITADHSGLEYDAKKEDNVKLGETVKYTSTDKNVVTTVTNNAIDFGLSDNISVGGKQGKDGSIGVKGADGTVGVTLNGKDGSIGLTGPKGADGKPGASANIAVKDGAEGVDGKNGKDGLPGENGKTRIVYETKDDGKTVTEQVATLNDGLIFSGNNEDVKNRQKLNTEVKVKGEGVDKTASENFKSASGNINVKANGTDTLEVQLAKAIDLTEDGSVTTGDTTVNNNGLTIKDGPSVTKGGIDAKGTKITNVKDGDVTATSKDAVNGSQLYQVQEVANAGWNLTANGKDKGNVKPGATVDLNNKDGNIIITKEGNNVTFGLKNNLTIGGKDGKDGQIGIAGKDGKDGVTIKGDGTITAGRDGKDGVDGSIGATGKDGASVVLNGKDGSIGLTGPKGADGKPGASANIAVKDGAEGVDGKNGKDGLPGENGKTRIVYETKDDGKTVTEQVATLNDGLIFSGNNEDVKNRQKLNTEVKVKGEGVDKTASENFKSASGNINVKANGTDTLEVQLAKAIDLTEDGSVTTGDTTVNNNGLTIKDGPSVTKGGIDAKGTKITNVKDGDVTATSKDAVNGSQLYQVQEVANAGWNLTANGKDKGNVKPGATVDLNNKDGNIIITKEGNNVTFGLKNNLTIGGKDGKDGQIGIAGKDGKDGITIKGDGTITAGRDGKDGVDGSIGATGKDGASVVLNGKDGSIGLTGPKGADGKPGASANIAVKDGAEGVDGKNGKDGLPGENGKTRIVYETKDDGKTVTEQVATLNDGLIFAGNNDKLNRHKLNSVVNIVGEVAQGINDKLSSENFKSAAGNINVVANEKDQLEIRLNRDLKDLATANFVEYKEDGSVNADAPKTVVNNNGVTVTPKDGKDGKDGNVVSLTKDGLNNGGNQIVNVKSGIDGLAGKDGINGKDGKPITSVNDLTDDQLKEVGTNAANINDVVNASNDIIKKGFSIAADNGETDHVKLGETVKYTSKDKNIITTVSDNVIDFTLNNDLTIGGPGKDGSIGVKGADGTVGVTLNGKDGSIGLTGPKGADGKDGASATISVKDGAKGLDGNDGKDGESKTRIVYEKPDGTTEEVATLNDGLRFVGDDGKEIVKKLNETLKISGGDTDLTNLSDNNIGVVNNNGALTVKLAKDIDLTKDGSVTIGDTTVNNDGLTIKDGPSVTKAGINAGDKKIINVQDGEISATSKDAVNGSQLYQVQEVANAGWNLTANGKDKGNVKPGATVDLNNKDGNIIITKEGNNVTFGLKNNLTIGGKDGKDGQIGIAGKDGKDGVTIKGDGTITAGRDGKDGVDGSIGATGKDGASVVLNGKDGSIGLTGPKGADGKPGASANIAVKDGAEGVDGKNGKDGLPGENGKTRIVYETKDDGKTVTEQVATLNDGLIFSGNNEDVKNRQKLNTEVKVKGEGVDKTASENFKSASGNINVKANGTDTLEVQLAKAIDLTEDGSVTTGDTTVNNNGLTIKDGPSVTKGGIDAKGTKITNVKDGDVTATSKDAVSGSQLYNAMQNTGWYLTVDGNVAETSEKGAQRVNNNGKVAVSGGKNIVVSRKGSTVEVATSSNLEFDSVKVGGTTISSTVAKDGVNELNIAGSKNAQTRITNVAPGVKGTDAVNVNQLKGAENRLNNRISNVDKDLRAGIAGALAAGNLYHVTQPGKSMVSAGVGAYRGQGAIAVGYSRLSDNGKVGIKFSVNSNSRGDTGAAASVGYQW